jgi:hypothetical protein
MSATVAPPVNRNLRRRTSAVEIGAFIHRRFFSTTPTAWLASFTHSQITTPPPLLLRNHGHQRRHLLGFDFRVHHLLADFVGRPVLRVLGEGWLG